MLDGVSQCILFLYTGTPANRNYLELQLRLYKNVIVSGLMGGSVNDFKTVSLLFLVTFASSFDVIF